MGRLKQVFEAPMDSTDELPIPPSPWHHNRSVDLFMEQWERILAFAATLDPIKAGIVASYAYSSDPHDVIDVPSEQLDQSSKFLTEVRASLEHAEPLEPEPTEEMPENFTNHEIARMIEAVLSVLQEAGRLRQPFRAWSEG
jgi:hypothetical protein